MKGGGNCIAVVDEQKEKDMCTLTSHLLHGSVTDGWGMTTLMYTIGLHVNRTCQFLSGKRNCSEL